jgi:hypothetical protein
MKALLASGDGDGPKNRTSMLNAVDTVALRAVENPAPFALAACATSLLPSIHTAPLAFPEASVVIVEGFIEPPPVKTRKVTTLPATPLPN